MFIAFVGFLTVLSYGQSGPYTIEVDLAYRSNFERGGKDDSYTRIMLLGKSLKEAGSPLSYTVPQSTKNLPGETSNGRNALFFRFENGSGAFGGSLFEAMGLSPISLNGLERLPVRGSLYIGANDDLKSLQVAAGLESARIPIIADRDNKGNISNWIYLGIYGQRQENRDADTDADGFLGTYEAAIGKNNFRRISGDAEVRKQLDSIAESQQKFLAALSSDSDTEKNLAMEVLLRIQKDGKFEELRNVIGSDSSIQEEREFVAKAEGDADTFEAACALRDYYRNHPPRTEQGRHFLQYMNGEFMHPAIEASKHYLELTYTPVSAWGIETRGWYDFSGKFGGDRLKTFTTATFEYWPSLANANVSIKLRYELGHERATPTERKNHLAIMFSLRY